MSVSCVYVLCVCVNTQPSLCPWLNGLGRWLGTWMLERANEGGAQGEGAGSGKYGAVEAWLSTNINPHRTFAEMSRHDKVALAFQHLDRDRSGCVPAVRLGGCRHVCVCRCAPA